MGKHCVTAQTVTDVTESKMSTQTNQDAGGKRASPLKKDLKNFRYLSIFTWRPFSELEVARSRCCYCK